MTKTVIAGAIRIFSIPAHTPGELPLQHLTRIAELSFRTHYVRSLKANVHHAIRAALVISRPILLPGCLLNQFLIGAVVVVGNQVARTLPPARIERGRAPGSAIEFPF